MDMDIIEHIIIVAWIRESKKNPDTNMKAMNETIAAKGIAITPITYLHLFGINFQFWIIILRAFIGSIISILFHYIIVV